MAIYGGLRVYSSGLSSEPVVQAFKIASGESEDIFQGDCVMMEATGTVTEGNADGDGVIAGVLLGVEYTNSDGQRVYTNKYNVDTSRTDNIAFVITDPFQQYIIRAGDGSGGTSTVTYADIGSSMDFDVTNAGNGTTGLSGILLENGTGAVTARARVIGVSNDDGSNTLIEAAANTFTHAIVQLDPTPSMWLGVGIHT
jgi:hypothetical protein